jgi:hypothetical protein
MNQNDLLISFADDDTLHQQTQQQVPPVRIAGSHTSSSNSGQTARQQRPSGSIINEQEYRTFKINRDYPLNYIIFHCIFLISVSVVQIAIGIVLTCIYSYDFLYSIGGGIWSGCFLVATSFVTLTTSKRQKPLPPPMLS